MQVKSRDLKICYKCHRPLPVGKSYLYRDVYLGPHCYSSIKKREDLRSSGSNPRLIKNSISNYSHIVSDNSTICPDDSIHCLECQFLASKECPLELRLSLPVLS